MSDQWPPAGHNFNYQVREHLEAGGGITLDLTVPRAMSRVELPTVRVGRHGGATDADLAFRDDLYRVVGSITVAGGHIEAAMKRLLLLLAHGETIFSLADYQWGDLHQRLLRECDDSDTRRSDLRKLLEWAETHDLRERRHTTVHGAWWIYSGCGVRISRWPRKAEGHILIGELSQIESLAERCWEFARRLDDLVGEDWARAMLPRSSPA